MKYAINLYILFNLLSIMSCSDKTGELIKPDLSPASLNADDFILSVTKDNVPADDYSYAAVDIELKPTAIAAKGVILTLITDNAIFSNGQKTISFPVSADTRISVNLKSDRAESAVVRLNVGEKFTKAINVRFIDALAEALILESSQPSLSHKSASAVSLKASLSRINGKTTNAQLVNYYDSAATGAKNVGTFLNVTRSDATGISGADYFLQDTTYRGFVYLKGFVGTGPNKVIATTRILIN